MHAHMGHLLELLNQWPLVREQWKFGQQVLVEGGVEQAVNLQGTPHVHTALSGAVPEQLPIR